MQDASYHVYAMVGLREFHPKAEHINFEAFSYAVLEYSSVGGGAGELVAPLRTPTEIFPSAEQGIHAMDAAGPLAEGPYASWGFSATDDYLPTAIQESLRPLGEDVVAPPAMARMLVSMGGAGNWCVVRCCCPGARFFFGISPRY